MSCSPKIIRVIYVLLLSMLVFIFYITTLGEGDEEKTERKKKRENKIW